MAAAVAFFIMYYFVQYATKKLNLYLVNVEAMLSASASGSTK